MLLPVIGLVQVGLQGHADRYTYLPEIGLYIMLVWLVRDLTKSWRRQAAVLSSVAVLVLSSLFMLSWQQTTTLARQRSVVDPCFGGHAR